MNRHVDSTLTFYKYVAYVGDDYAISFAVCSFICQVASPGDSEVTFAVFESLRVRL